jgi:hypothetical protein
MNIRKTTSLVAALAFIIMIITSIILYIVPHGRIAYWADWQLIGLSKTQWGNIHINSGFLFLIALGLHTYYNWNAIVRYLKNQSKKIVVFTREFNVALIITFLFVAGTYLMVPPFSSILDFSEGLKEKAVVEYGEPPYGHAELSSLKTFAGKMKLDLDKSMTLLSNNGVQIKDEKQSLSAIGKANQMSPQQIFEIIKTAKSVPGNLDASSTKLPDSTPSGFGRMTLNRFCERFKLDADQTLSHLKKNDVKASKTMTIKEIAAENNTSPMDLYELLKAM